MEQLAFQLSKKPQQGEEHKINLVNGNREEMRFNHKGSHFRFKKSQKKIFSQTVKRLQKIDNDKISIRGILWVDGCEPALSKFSLHPKLTSIVSKVLNTNELSQLVNQAHYKLPGDTVTFDWHQDSQFRGHGTSKWKDINGKGSFCQAVTAIDPMNAENGALKFIPGSSVHGHLGIDKMNKEERKKYFNESDAFTLDLKPGDAAFFGPYT